MLSTMRKTRIIEHCRCYHLISRLYPPAVRLLAKRGAMRGAHWAFFLNDEEKTHAVKLCVVWSSSAVSWSLRMRSCRITSTSSSMFPNRRRSTTRRRGAATRSCTATRVRPGAGARQSGGRRADLGAHVRRTDEAGGASRGGRDHDGGCSSFHGE